MPARRRRTGSESEQTPFTISGDNPANKRPNDYANSRFPNNVIENSHRYQYQCLEEEIEYAEPDIIMTAIDRTEEFVNTIQSVQGRYISRAVAAKDVRKSRVIQSHSEFMLIARNVGKNIASTFAKLQKLTELVKKNSLFNDTSAEIQDLTYIIKSDLNSLNQEIAKLQEVSKRQRQSINGKHLLSHSSSVVLTLQSKLATMSTDFKQILEVRTENLKHQKTRRDQFSYGTVNNTLPPSVMTQNQGSLLLQEQDQVSIDFDSNSTMQTALMPYEGQMQMTQQLRKDHTDNYLQSRADTMQNIESTIVELGGIFQQLAHMVKEQEEMVDRIDTNVQDAEMNIEAAHTQILKYFQSVTSNRWLMIKIFAVLIFFFVFFVVFMA